MAGVKAKVSKDDLRRLMKERRENLKEHEHKVDSPFAKYDSLGNLYCITCNIKIKSSGHWTSHVAGKVHKENALRKKKGSEEIVPLKAACSESQPIKKRSSEFLQPLPAKKLKANNEVPKSSKPEIKQSTGKLALLDEYSSSSDDEIDKSDTKSSQAPIPSNKPTSVLPTDFFDPAASISTINDVPSKEKEVINPAEVLPEGFFDDPVLDAKARNIEYKDPVEEEWERYQKAIAEETNVSKTIIAEDLEESVLERDITQIDEQILQWQKIKELESLVEAVKLKAPPKEEKMDLSGSSDDELDEDELLDWRTKSVAKR